MKLLNKIFGRKENKENKNIELLEVKENKEMNDDIIRNKTMKEIEEEGWEVELYRGCYPVPSMVICAKYDEKGYIIDSAIFKPIPSEAEMKYIENCAKIDDLIRL